MTDTMRNSFAAAFCILALSIDLSARAATVTVGALKDATIFQNNPNNSSGGGNGLFAGTNGTGSPRRALLAFDVAAVVPAGASVDGVELILHLADFASSGGGNPPGGAAQQILRLHRLLASWGEGTRQTQNPPSDSVGGQGQGAPADEGDVTWNARHHAASSAALWLDGEAAASPGGYFAGAASAGALVGTTIGASYAWTSTPALIDDVQSWLDDPSTNFGWLLKNADEGTSTNFRALYSRNTATPELRPQLIISYTVNPQPADFNNDGAVDGADLARWQAGFGPAVSPTDGDADFDGDADGADFLLWQRGIAAPTRTMSVPEPRASLMIAISILITAQAIRTSRHCCD